MSSRPILPNALRALGWAAALAVASTLGCSTTPDDPAAAADGADPLQRRLEAETGSPWVVLRDPFGQVAVAMPAGGPVRVAGMTADEEGALRFFERFAGELGIHAPRERLALISSTESPSGDLRSFVFDEHVPGLATPVFHGGVAAHFTKDGLIAWVQPSFTANLDRVPRAAALSPADAVTRARMNLRAARPEFDAAGAGLAREPSLGVLENLGVTHLTYELTLDSDRGGLDIFLDARDGTLLHAEETTHAAFGRAFSARHYIDEKILEQRDFFVLPVRPTAVDDFHAAMAQPWVPGFAIGLQAYSAPFVDGKAFLRDDFRVFGDVASDEWDKTGRRGEGSAVDAFANLNRVANWFRDTMKRESFDGKGKTINFVVHDNRFNRFGAFYSGVDDVISFEDGIPGVMLPPAIALDFAAHEYMHANTRYLTGGAPLGLAAEAALIDEALSDIFAANAEHDLLPGDGNLLMGESIAVGRRAFRDLANPSAPDLERRQLDQYDRRVVENTDAHVASGIPIKAWALMTLGGTHGGVMVPSPLGWTRSRELWWDLVRSLRTKPSGWVLEAIAHQMVANAAVNRANPREVDTVACAWMAVNVLSEQRARAAIRRAPACQPTAAPAAPSSSGCLGRPDGLRCDEANPFSALVCKNGGIVGVASCADLSLRCVRKSPTDAAAVTDPDGQLVCE